MNGLSLRISGKGGNDSRKNDSKLIPMVLQKCTVERFIGVLPDFIKFYDASAINVQLEYVRRISKLLLEDLNISLPKKIGIDFLVMVFLEAPLKHPLKNACSRLLSTQKSFQDDIRKSISTALSINMSECSFEDMENMNNISNSVNSCFENFPLGIAGIQHSIVNTLPFSKSVIKTYVDVLISNHKLSPTEKMKIYLYIHNTQRSLFSILQQCEISSESLNTNIDWEEMCMLCIYLLNHADLPMDTKGNSCMILLVIMRHKFGPDAWIAIMKENFSKNKDEKCQQDGEIEKLNSDIVTLCIYGAIINIVNSNELCSNIVDDTPALNFICSKLIVMSEKLSVDTTIILGIARTMLTISRLLVKVDDLDIAVLTAERILYFVWSYLEYYVDSVRHLTTQMLSNIVKLSVTLEKKGSSQLSSKVLSSVMMLPKDRQSKYKGLATLGLEYGCCFLLEKIPNVVEDLLSAINNITVPANVSTAFESLMLKHSKEVSIDVLLDTWIKPVLNALMMCKDDDENNSAPILAILEDILAKAVKLNSDLVPLMIPTILQPNSNKDSLLTDGQFKCILVCLHVARRMGLFDGKVNSNTLCNESDQWKDIISYKLLEDAMTHQVSEIRMLAFSLIVDSHKTTEYFTEKELEISVVFYTYNINVQSPAVRQRIIGLSKKLLKRAKDGFDVILRNIEILTNKETLKSTNPTNTVNSARVPKNISKTESLDFYNAMKIIYQNYFERLWFICMKNIFPGANFSRRNVSLQMLLWFQEFEKSSHIEWIWRDHDIELLLNCLDDTYECNKQLAVDVLLHCPPVHLKFDDEKTIKLFIYEALNGTSSIKPTDCISAAFKFALLCKFPDCIVPVLRKIIKVDGCPPCEVHYLLASLLVESLVKEMEIAKADILLGAAKAPMYGCLVCIRHLIENIDFRKISTSSHWASFISKIIKFLFEVNEIVAPIVNNSSPEGHLPMDFNAGTTCDEGNGVRLKDGLRVTAQMVLLCGWRSVKEVSLLLGDISQRAILSDKSTKNHQPENGDNSGTISGQELLQIGEHFISLLSETKHRGAFEQAYLGFSKLCARLWECQSEDLHNLPRIWLDDLITTISSGDLQNSKFCATRRSAGVPYMVQALVTTELQVCGSPQSFQKCMFTLITLATFENPDTSHNSVETRTHCLNILRTLYRHTALGEYVNSYVADGLMTAITGFDGATWAERNSSTLLFSGLMTRIFGVQRTKDSDDLCIRNRMTGRIFFLRYPKLYDFILNHLRDVKSDANSKNVFRPSLYPVLLLLARLYPSSLEGTDSNLQLVAYIPYLLTCAESCVLKTRQLAAKAMVPLISRDRYFAHFTMLLEILCDKNIKRNYCHGILLQLIRLLQSVPEDLEMDESSAHSTLTLLDSSKWILLQILENYPCFLIAEAYANVVLLLLDRFNILIKPESQFLKDIRPIIEFKPELLNQSYKLFFSKEEFYCRGFHLNIHLSFLTNDMESMPSLLIKGLTSPMYEVTLLSLNYLLCLYNYDNYKYIDEKFELGNTEKKFVESVKEDDVSKILNWLHSSMSFEMALFDLLKPDVYKQCQQKSIMLLTFLPTSLNKIIAALSPDAATPDAQLTALIDHSQTELENISYVYLRCINKYFSSLCTSPVSIYEHFSEETIELLSETLCECSGAEKTLNKRMEVAEIITTHWEFLDWKKSHAIGTRFKGILLQWSALLQLLDDDDEVVRVKMAYIANILTDQKTRQLKTCHNLSFPFNDSKSKEIIIETIASWMSEISVDNCIYILILLALGIHNSYEENVLDHECRVFDKGEMNIFQEDLSLTYLCVNQIGKEIAGNQKPRLHWIKNILLSNQQLGDWAKSCVDDFPILLNLIKIYCENEQNKEEQSARQILITELKKLELNNVNQFKIKTILLFLVNK